MAALLFYIDSYNQTVTTLSCIYVSSMPVEYTIKPTSQRVTELESIKPQVGHTSKKQAQLNEPVDRIRGYVCIGRVMELRRELSDSNAGTLGFHQVWPEAVDIRQEAQLVNQLVRCRTCRGLRTL